MHWIHLKQPACPAVAGKRREPAEKYSYRSIRKANIFKAKKLWSKRGYQLSQSAALITSTDNSWPRTASIFPCCSTNYSAEHIRAFSTCLNSTKTHSHTHSLTQTNKHTLTHSLTNSLTHSLVHTITHSHTHTLTHTDTCICRKKREYIRLRNF